jgi:hypothetical protein
MGENVINEVDYSFSENGLVAYKNGELIGKEVRDGRTVSRDHLMCCSLCFNSKANMFSYLC